MIKITKKNVKNYKFEIYGLDEENLFSIFITNNITEDVDYIELDYSYLCYGELDDNDNNWSYKDFTNSVVDEFMKSGVDVTEVINKIMWKTKDTRYHLRSGLSDYFNKNCGNNHELKYKNIRNI